MGSFINGPARGFIRSAVNQVGRDAGRVVSNQIYGDAHSIPHRNVSAGDELVDMFLLMFLLIGINVRDLFALTKENIVRGRLEYDRAKTGRHYSILLHPEAIRIIEKYKGEKTLLRFSEHFKTVDSATVMINKKLAKIRPGLTTYYARHTWASIAFNLGIQKDVVSLALGHSFGVRVTDTYINADLSRVDDANRMVIDYVLYNKK